MSRRFLWLKYNVVEVIRDKIGVEQILCFFLLQTIVYYWFILWD